MKGTMTKQDWSKDLAELGCAFEPEEASRDRLILGQLLTLDTNMLFELNDGRVGLVMDMRISSRLDRRTKLALRLEAPWGRLNICLLPNPSTRSRKYEHYDFPETNFGFDRSAVINEYLCGKHALNPGDEIEGLLLAVCETPIPNHYPDLARIPVRVSIFDGCGNEASLEFRLIVDRGAVCSRSRARKSDAPSKSMSGR